MVPIPVNGESAYGVVSDAEGGVRVRVSLDDWERLGRFLGQQVRAEIRGRETGHMLLASAEASPPFVWLTFQELASRRAS